MSAREGKAIEIVGGGLAGLALGIALRRAEVPVTVIEAGDYPRHRVCGEFISGLAERTVVNLGLENVFEGALRHARAAWFSGERTLGELTLPSPAIGISRFTLDARLAERFVALGGRLETRQRVTQPELVEGRVIAAGRRRAMESEWVGLKAHVRGITPVTDLELHLGEGAYVGLSRVEDGWVNVCGLFRRRTGLSAESTGAWARTLRGCGLVSLAAKVEAAELRPGSASAVAGFVFDRGVECGAGVSLGDSCAVIPPFTGNGMAMAFTSAELALKPLTEWSMNGLAWTDASKRIHALLTREFSVRLRTAGLLHPLLLTPRAQRGLEMLGRWRLLPMGSLYRLLH